MNKLVCLLLLCLTACAGDPRVGQYQAAQVLADAQVTAGGQLDAARAAELAPLAHGSPERAAAVARWLPVGQALDAVKDAITLWIAAVAFEGSADLLALATHAVELYRDLVGLAANVGVSLPRL